MIFVELNGHSEQWTFYFKALLNFMELDVLFQSFVELYCLISNREGLGTSV